jgi:cyclin-dependent kinase 8/11
MEDQIAKAVHIPVPSAPISAMPLPPYTSKVKVLDKYHIIGFISSGTYGRVYKARSRHPGTTGEFAIKKYGSFSRLDSNVWYESCRV